MYVCMSVTLRNAKLSVRGVRWKYGVHTQPHYCCQQATMQKYSSTTDQSAQWITDPTKDEGDRMLVSHSQPLNWLCEINRM